MIEATALIRRFLHAPARFHAKGYMALLLPGKTWKGGPMRTSNKNIVILKVVLVRYCDFAKLKTTIKVVDQYKGPQNHLSLVQWQ